MENANGSKDNVKGKDDAQEDIYRDDPDAFGEASETAGGGTANHYDGSGLEGGSRANPSPTIQKGNNHGDQSEWQKDAEG